MLNMRVYHLELKHESIVVTGGAGFLGSHLVGELESEGVQNIFIPRSKEYDLVEKEAVIRLLKDSNPSIIIHLAAAVGGIGANLQHPGSFFYQNLMMGVQLIEQARLAKIKKFVAIGTICSYPKFAHIPFKEDDLWNGYPEETNAPYGLAKKMMLVQSQAYRQQYSFNSIFLLPVNLYGPKDNFDPESSHVIPAMIKKFYAAKLADEGSVTLWGDGTPTREFLHVKDCARGIVLATKHYNKSDPVNLGSGRELSIRDLANLISHKIGYVGKIVWDVSKPNGQPRRQLDVSKAQKEFGFSAEIDFDNGLTESIEWYLKNKKD